MPPLVNASPAYYLQGASDLGSVPLPITRDAIPQHVPLIFTFAEKGTTKKLLATGAGAIANYGANTFNVDSAYFGHTTRFAKEMYGAANACMHQRVTPTDAGAPANVVLYIDILHEPVGTPTRNPVTGLITRAVGTTVPGNHIKFVTEPAVGAFGSAVTKPGTFTNVAGTATSTMYPIYETRANAAGIYYNNNGLITSPLGANLDTNIANASKAMTYSLALVNRPTAGGSPVVRKSLFGEQSVKFTLMNNVTDPVTGTKVDLKSVFDNNWFNETDPLLPIAYNEYEGIHVYYAEIALALGVLHTGEIPQVTATNLHWYDYTSAVPAVLGTESGLIDILALATTKGVPYATIVKASATLPSTLTAGQQIVNLGAKAPIYQQGGSDGTLTNAMFETVVGTEMAKYLDPNSSVMDNAVNVETHLYDSGFTVPFKPTLLNFMGLRKDAAVALSTHDDALAVPLPLSAARAVAAVLKTAALMFPESDYFGTPTARAIIASGAERLHSDVTKAFHAMTFEIGIKTARLMGAGNYKWNAVNNFDHGPEATLSAGYDYQPSFIPEGVKPTLWNDGMIWAQPKDMHTYFIPAMQTVYTNDTSPLNSWLTVCALVSLNRVASDAWREFTGTATMSDAVFKDAVLSYLQTRLEGIFDGLLTVIPTVIIDQKDAQRGFSWQIAYRLYAGTMKTAMVSYTEVYRLNALPA